MERKGRRFTRKLTEPMINMYIYVWINILQSKCGEPPKSLNYVLWCSGDCIVRNLWLGYLQRRVSDSGWGWEHTS